MADLSGDIANMVFGRVDKGDIGNFSIDSQMLNVLMVLDGQNNVAYVAQKTGLSMGDIREVLNKLLTLGLVAPVVSGSSVLEADFFAYLQEQLALAVGPIAGVLIEDGVADLGYGMDNFPNNRAAELVDLLAREIQREEKIADFKKNMVNKLIAK
jgi:hypothetical protein